MTGTQIPHCLLSDVSKSVLVDFFAAFHRRKTGKESIQRANTNKSSYFGYDVRYAAPNMDKRWT